MSQSQHVLDNRAYHPRDDECELFELARENMLPLLIKGPAGCGTKRFVEHMAARSGSRLYTVTCHEDLSPSDLIGRYLLRGNETVWVDGPLTRAVREGAICYLDEIVEARSDLAQVLHPLTDHGQILNIGFTGEELVAQPGFMLVASFNPRNQNKPNLLLPSLRQRFLAICLDFPPPETEITVVAKESGLEPARVAPLVRLGGHIRARTGIDLEEGASTRLLINAAILIVSGMPVLKAINAAIVEPLTDNADTRAVLLDMVASVYG